MIIKNVSQAELSLALQKLNEKYNNPGFERDPRLRKTIEEEGNIIYMQCFPTNKKEDRWNVRLECRSRFAVGHRIHDSYFRKNPMNSRYACWDTHGNYFKKLIEINPDVVIVSMGQKIDQHGGNWIDRNIGSIIQPMMYSDACECFEIENLPSLSKHKEEIKYKLHTVKFVKMKRTNGKIEPIKIVLKKQSEMTSDCWSIQFEGLEACIDCEFKDTDNCGGGQTLKELIKNA